MRVAVLSANLGAYDRHVEWELDQKLPAGVTVDFHRFTDADLPPRPLAMTSRLQAGIVKMFGWQLRPGYHVYIWVDAARGLLRNDSVAWFLDQLEPTGKDYGGKHLVVFKHDKRRTIREEYEFVKARMARPLESYLNSRYRDEWLDEQYAVIAADANYVDDRLYASTAFVYRPVPKVIWMLKEWWGHKSRFLLHDQLAFPYVVRQSGIAVRELGVTVDGCGHLPFTRHA